MNASFFTWFNSWATCNTLTALLVCTIVLIVWRLSRKTYWQLAFKQIAASKTAMISAVILVIYLFVALADSIGWRRPILDPQTHQPYRNSQTNAILYDEGASALDYLLAPLSNKKESTYSAPLAQRQYTSVMGTTADGKIRFTYPRLKYPGSHPCGTDIIGEDVLYQALKSIRTALVIGVLTTLIAIPFALFFGLTSGFYGGFLDTLVQFLCTLLNAIPTILLVASIMLIFKRGLPQLCFAMGIGSWTVLCRLIRGETMKLRETDFIQASLAIGTPGWRIILWHILPNVMHIILIHAVLRFSSLVLTEATLTYLGLGVDADSISWGTMINDARTELTRVPIIWWKLSTAFIFMVGLVLPANLFSDALRDALDPKLRTK